MDINALLKKLTRELSVVAEELSSREAEQIIEDVTGFDRGQLYRHRNTALSKQQITKAETFLKQRLTGKPLPYVLGYADFWDQRFKTTPAVLIPRPDTETLIVQILSHEAEHHLRVLDMGTGSGIIAQILAGQRSAWSVYATDRSLRAVPVARRNCLSSVRVICMDLLRAFRPEPLFDFIVSNPPYIADETLEKLDCSVRDFEPHEALAGGEDGLDYYRYLSTDARRYLTNDGRMYCEIGYDQGEKVSILFKQAGWQSIEVFTDLGGRPRVVRAVHGGYGKKHS